jgi:hypothetical protein
MNRKQELLAEAKRLGMSVKSDLMLSELEHAIDSSLAIKAFGTSLRIGRGRNLFPMWTPNT